MHQSDNRLYLTPYSHQTDEEFLRHLLNKAEPTAEEVEAALRFELLLGSYTSLLEKIHQRSTVGLGDTSQTRAALTEIHQLTAAA